jgi:hypothetical protein
VSLAGDPGPLIGDYGKVWLPITQTGRSAPKLAIQIGRMYRDEPTGDITWHWAGGPAAEMPVWVGPRLGKECDEWCNTTNNPGYAVSPAPECDNFNSNGEPVCTSSASWCAARVARNFLDLPRVNHYCAGTFDDFGTPEEQAEACLTCYLTLTKRSFNFGEYSTKATLGASEQSKDTCME